MWGGVSLAAAMLVAERATRRESICAVLQYIRPVKPGARLDLRVQPQSGFRISQVQVAGYLGNDLAVTGLVSLRVPGAPAGPDLPDAQYVSYPDEIPGPEDCEPRHLPTKEQGDTILGRFEQRWARPQRHGLGDGIPGRGRSALWMRFGEPIEKGPGPLAVLADMAPVAIGEAIGLHSNGTSLDNTMRFAHPWRGSDWVLMDVQVESIVGSVAQMSVRMFDEDGHLVALGSQSAAIRLYGDAGK
jgi:acyl-CoA thioesterase